MSTIAHISLAQFELMMEHGVFDGEHHQRVELIRGEIRQMNPIGYEHAMLVNYLNGWSAQVLSTDCVMISIQNPLLLPDSDSVPEPDVCWIARCKYERHPTADDVLLVIEVADSTLETDRDVKGPLYAAAGITDYWIVNLPERCLEVRRDPADGAYQQVTLYRGDEDVRPLTHPHVVLQPNLLFSGE